MLIEDLLDFSKIEAGKVELSHASFSLRAELDSILTTFSLRARHKGLRLLSNIDQAACDGLLGDAGKLRQILLNLLGNALKFTDQGEVELSVSALPAAETDRSGSVGLKFSVRDTGIGIARDKHALVFEAFTQEDSSTTRRYGGTGLGLTIAARLVRLLGGEVTLESEPGQGSTFSFVVHFARAATVGPDAESSAFLQPAVVERPSLPALAPQRLRILVAEDNDFNGMLMLALLKKHEHRVEIVKRGSEAIARAESGEFDLMLLDLHMPDVDGFEVIRRVRERERVHSSGRRLPVIACTARSRKEEEVRCLAAGMDYFLAKPIRSAALWSAIDQVTVREPAHDESAALIDVDALLASCDGDPAILASLCAILRAQLPKQMAHALACSADRDGPRLRESAHKLFGIVATVSTRAGALASRLEDEAEQGDLDAAAASALGLQSLVSEILTHMAGVDAGNPGYSTSSDTTRA